MIQPGTVREIYTREYLVAKVAMKIPWRSMEGAHVCIEETDF